MKTVTKVQKQVQIIARIAIKNSNLVVYKVRSSNGKDTYQTTFYNGKASGCTCPATKPCYHMTQLQKREDERLIANVDTMIADAQAKIAAKTAPRQAEEWDFSQPLSREAYNDLFSPNDIPGMY